MPSTVKNQAQILQKLRIEKLNQMQEEAILAIESSGEVVLLSPTGTGKTLAFLLPLVARLNRDSEEVQALIIAPSRELAIQLEQVAREMGAGHKINAFYGGRNFSKDRMDLKHRPAVLIGTPGRIADHLRRKTFDTREIQMLVLDEFDKSLEVGFESEMTEICEAIKVEQKVLTSATHGVMVPRFVGLSRPVVVNYLQEGESQLQIKRIVSPDKDKLDTLVDALCHIGKQPGIIFCSYKDSIQRISDHLLEHGIQHGCFFGGMEQKDRERALLQFRNGTHRILIATDLAARGIDIPEIKFILHYHLPGRREEFTHRNGRTARMHREGTAYILHWKGDKLPDYLGETTAIELLAGEIPYASDWATLFISGGRKDKISKGDIAGFFFKQGQLKKGTLGIIEVKQDCAFVAVPRGKAKELAALMDNSRLKKKKVRCKLL